MTDHVAGYRLTGATLDEAVRMAAERASCASAPAYHCDTCGPCLCPPAARRAGFGVASCPMHCPGAPHEPGHARPVAALSAARVLGQGIHHAGPSNASGGHTAPDPAT